MVSALRKQREEERKRRTRQQLLKAAARVFARSRYHRSTVSDIVAEAGMGQGTFYRNFRDERHRPLHSKRVCQGRHRLVITDINAEGLKDAERMLADCGVEVFAKVVNVTQRDPVEALATG